MGSFDFNRDAAAEIVTSAVWDGLEKSARAIERHAKQLAPVRKTGRAGESSWHRTTTYTREEALAVLSLPMWWNKGHVGVPGGYRGPASVSTKTKIRSPKFREKAFKQTLSMRQSIFPEREKRLGIHSFDFRESSMNLTGFGGRARWEIRQGAKAIRARMAEGPALERRSSGFFDVAEETSGAWGGKSKKYGNRGAFILAEAPNAKGGGTHHVFQYGGRLRRDIEFIGRQDASPGVPGNVIAARVMSNAPYSLYVEFPTRRTKAQPFLMPALKGERSNFVGRMARQMRSYLKG